MHVCMGSCGLLFRVGTRVVNNPWLPAASRIPTAASVEGGFEPVEREGERRGEACTTHPQTHDVPVLTPQSPHPLPHVHAPQVRSLHSTTLLQAAASASKPSPAKGKSKAPAAAQQQQQEEAASPAAKAAAASSAPRLSPAAAAAAASAAGMEFWPSRNDVLYEEVVSRELALKAGGLRRLGLTPRIQ